MNELIGLAFVTLVIRELGALVVVLCVRVTRKPKGPESHLSGLTGRGEQEDR